MSVSADIAAAYNAFKVREQICKDHPRFRLDLMRHAGQAAMLASRHKIRVAATGNGWGKTTICAYAVDEQIQHNPMYNRDLVKRWPQVCIWVTQKYQQFDIIKNEIEHHVFTPGFKWNESKKRYLWPNGGTLYVVSSDSDWMSIQGIEPDLVVFDEHPPKDLWVEMQFRRRGRRKTRYLVAATMTQGLTWFVRDYLQDWEQHHRDLGLTMDQAREQQAHPDVWVMDKGGILDNPSMGQEDFEHYQSQAVSDAELGVRTYGGYAEFNASPVFSPPALKEQHQNIEQGDGVQFERRPVEISSGGLVCKVGDRDIRHAGLHRLKKLYGPAPKEHVSPMSVGTVDGGRITIYEPPDPEATYVMGADFAYGLIDNDYDACVVLKKTRDGVIEQVAEAHGHWGDIFFAKVLQELGLWYYGAFLVGERQVGLPCMRRLYDEMGYGFIFKQRREQSRSRRISDALGHHRSAGDTIIPNLRLAIQRGDIILRSEDLLHELKLYQFRPRRTTDDRIEGLASVDLTTGAPQGSHDDLVMALAYGWHGCREIGEAKLPEEPYRPGTHGARSRPRDVLRPKPKDPYAVG